MTNIDKLQLERYNITPPGLRPSTKQEIVEALNNTSYQLDWLAQLLGFSNSQYWDDLNLSIFEKRRILLNALSCDPELRFPLNKSAITNFRIIDVSATDTPDLILLDQQYPILHLYAGLTYIFNVEQYPTFEISSSYLGGAIPKEDLSQLLFVIDRREDGYIIAVPTSANIPSIIETSYYGFDIANGLRETDWGLIRLYPKRNITDWIGNRKPIRKNVTLDNWEDNGITWYGATIYDNIPMYPKYTRTDNPPDGFIFTNQRPDLVAEEDYLSAQAFRYDNDFFKSSGFPELVYRQGAFYDFFGVHGSKGSAFSFNFMMDALGYEGYNDDALVRVSYQPNYDATTGDYVPGRSYSRGDVFVFNNDDNLPGLDNYLFQSWYFVKEDYVAVSVPEDLINNYVEAIASPRKAVYQMFKDTRNGIIPLRPWVQRDLQVANSDNITRYANKLVAGKCYSLSENSIGIYHIRLPLEYERNGVAWQRINLIARTYLYFGDESPQLVPNGQKLKHQDYRIGYAYFAANHSAAGEAVFTPERDTCLFSPTDPRDSLYVKNKY